MAIDFNFTESRKPVERTHVLFQQTICELAHGSSGAALAPKDRVNVASSGPPGVPISMRPHLARAEIGLEMVVAVFDNGHEWLHGVCFRTKVVHSSLARLIPISGMESARVSIQGLNSIGPNAVITSCALQ